MGNNSSQGRPSSIPIARRTARYSVFKDRWKLRECLFRAPEAKDETGWPRRATPGNRAAQCMRAPRTGQALELRGVPRPFTDSGSCRRIAKGEAYESSLSDLNQIRATPQDQ